MKKICIILSLGIIVYLSGCKLGPDFQKLDYEGPASFRFDQPSLDTIVNLRWWELFNDPVLDTLIKRALENNKDVMVAAARVEAARANLGFTKADQWPSFTFNVGAGSGNSNGVNQFNSVTNNFYAYPEMYWEIGFWGKYRRLNESARADLLASEYGLRTVQIGLISGVASTYFSLLDNIKKLDISRKTLSARDSSMQIIQARYDYGIVAEIDLNQSQIQRAISAAAIPTYERQIAYSQSAISILLGEYPSDIPIGKELFEQVEPADIPTGLPSQLLLRRPDVKQAEAAYAAQNARIGAAQAMRWPSLNLTALLGVASTDLTSLTTAGLGWSVGGVILGPLFQFGKNKRRVEIERANTEAVLRQYENTALQAFKEVEDALISIQTLQQELIAQRSRSAAAMNAEYLSNERYDKGETSYLEVLESQRQSFEAQLALSQTKGFLLNAYVALYKALGGGWLSPEEEQAFIESKQAAEQQLK
ncbi:MAG: efflux transporter outer membrane subunit [Bacteroidetes bacterium]|nr:efflux transporter outer membrane subunit [Bacteroidota bacterium]